MLSKLRGLHIELIKSTAKESSKRYIALTTQYMVCLSHCFVLYKGDAMDIIILIGADFGFIATLLGISTYENNLKEKLKHNDK